MTKLVEGRIPVGSVCPFKDKCEIGSSCYHTGKFHRMPFSCATARAYDLIERYELEPKLLTGKGGSNGKRKGEALSS